MSFAQNHAAIVLAVIFSMTLVFIRTVVSGQTEYVFFVGNLLLAWIPYALAHILIRRTKSGPFGILAWLLSFSWLIFLPNTFYLLTDFAHLPLYGVDSFALLYQGTLEHSWLWFDLILIGACVWAGMLLGFLSVKAIHEVLLKRVSEKTAAACIVLVLTLAAIGIYLGRVARFNSWEIVSNPWGLVSYATSGAGNIQSQISFFSFVVPLAMFLVLIYFSVFGWRRGKILTP